MHFSVVFTVLGILISSETSFANEVTPPYPICIIGGGISGLSLSFLLQEKGYPVSLFEANSYFGGKVDTYKTNDGIILEKGPLYFTISPTMHYISKYIKMFNISTIPYKLFDFEFFNPINGQMYGKYQLNEEQKKKLVGVAKRYRKAYEATYNIQDDYSKIAPNSDLALSTLVFLKKHDIEDLRLPLSFFVTILGYGALEDTPVAYVLRIIPPDDMDILLREQRSGNTARDGFATFMEKMAEKVESKYLNYEAINLNRGHGKQEVEFLVNGSTLVTRTCSKTILAFPPLLSNLLKLIPDLSQEEKKLFAKVKVNKYISSGHIIPSLHHIAYLGLTPNMTSGGGDGAFPEMEYPYGGGEVIALAKSGKGSNPYAYQSYSWVSGDYDNEPTASDLRTMERKMHAILKRLHPSYTTEYTHGWFQYSPHVTGESIRSGFYKELENMQGRDGIYYGTTLLTFESMNGALEMAEIMVNKYFS